MQIIDLDNKKREVEYVRRVLFPVHDTISHEDVMTEFVQVMIIGLNRKWIEWYPLKEFKKANPKVKID